MTASPPSIHPAPAGSPDYRVIPVSPEQREQAALRLVQAGSGGTGRTDKDAKALLRSAKQQGFNFDFLFAALRNPDGPAPSIASVAWAVQGAGNTWMFFTTAPASASTADELGAVLTAACTAIRDAGHAGLAQALVAPAETLPARAFIAGGFTQLATLRYLRRRCARPKLPPKPTDWATLGVELVPFPKATDARLAHALKATYIDTLDCPGLSEMRPIEDVIASHRATGEHDPTWWWLLRDQQSGQDAGALLLSPCPDQSNVELVYVGLAPTLRRRGIARALLRFAIHTVAERAETALACAVDERNEPALKMYEALDFAPFARRIALVRNLRD